MPNIRFSLNGVETEIDADPDSSLLGLLRGPLGLTSPHFGCGSGECGACRVIVGDHAVTACDTPLWSVTGKEVTTIEGLGSAEKPHPLQRAFIAEQAIQCGYCVSGILMSAAALLMQSGAKMLDIKTPDIVSVVSSTVFPAAHAQARPAITASKTGRRRGRIDKGDIVAIDVMIISSQLLLIGSRCFRADPSLPGWRAPAIGDAEPVPDVDRGNGRGQVGQFLVGKFRARLRVDFVADARRQQRQRLGPGQRRTFARGKLRHLTPHHDKIELVDRHAEPLRLKDMILHAEGAAVDLRRPQLDQLEQRLLDAGLGGKTAERENALIGVRCQRLKIAVFLPGM